MTNSIEQLKALPPQRALALLLQEKARRARSRYLATVGPEYPPEFPPQSSLVMDPSSPFHDLLIPARYKIYYGGRDSAKSWSFAEALVRRARDHPLRILCTREYQNSIRDSVHHLLEVTIHRFNLMSWFTITQSSVRSKAGAEFIFKGLHNNVEEIKSTEGIDICWVEEAHFTTDDSWKILIPTIRRERSEIWITFNVIDENMPTYQRFVTHTPPDSIIHKVNYAHNKFLSTTSNIEIEDLRARDYAAYEHVYMGEPLKISESVIFGGRFRVEGFSDDLWKEAPRIFFGLDFGFAQDPTALVRSFILNRKLYIEWEAWGIGVELGGDPFKFKYHPDNFANLPRRQDDRNVLLMRGELDQMIDTVPGSRSWPIKADSARPETISALRERGFNVSAAEKWKGSVEDGIAHVKGFEEIIIHTRCVHTIQESRLYSYKRDSITKEVLPVVLDKHNHCWDAIRYSLDGHIKRRGDLGIWARLAH